MSFRSWSIIPTQTCLQILSDLCLHFFIWYLPWQRHLCIHLIRTLSSILMVDFCQWPDAMFPNDHICRFIYMGFDIAMEKHSWSHVGFIFFSIVSFYASSFGLIFNLYKLLLLLNFLIYFLWRTSAVHRNCEVPFLFHFMIFSHHVRVYKFCVVFSVW